MKKLFLLFILLSTANSYAQLEEHYAQYMNNRFLINPGAFAPANKIRAIAFYRAQEVLPGIQLNSQSISIQMPLRYNSIGFGAVIRKDEQPGLSSTAMKVATNYKIKIFSGLLALGIETGPTYKRIDFSDFNPKDPSDPSYLSKDNNWSFDLGYGLYYESKHMYAGVSHKHLFNNLLGSYGIIVGEKYRHNAIVGFYPYPKAKIGVSPSLFYQKSYLTKAKIDVNLLVDYLKNFWVAGSLTSLRQWGVQGGLVVNSLLKSIGPKIRFGYAFQSGTDESTIRSTTNEVFLSLSWHKKASFSHIKNLNEYNGL